MSRPGLRRGVLRRALAAVTIVTLAVTTLSGCIPGDAPGSGGSASAPRLYTGPIPPPAPLTASDGLDAIHELQEGPMPPDDLSDPAALEEYQRQLEEYLKKLEEAGYLDGDGEPVPDVSGINQEYIDFATQVSELADATHASDEASVAAWESLLVTAGIAVGIDGRAVEVNGATGEGVPMSEGELRLHALLAAGEAEISLVHLAEILGGLGVFDESTLAQALYDDLLDPGSTGFGAVFNALKPTTFVTVSYGRAIEVPLEEVTLTTGQALLVLRKLANDLLAVGDDADADPVAAAEQSSDGMATASLRWDAMDLCTGKIADPALIEARRGAAKGVGYYFAEAVNDMAGGAQAKLAYTAAQSLLALASVAAQMWAIQADISMADSPLVRTKDTVPGERRELAIRLYYPKGTLEDARQCTAAMLRPFGIDMSDFGSGDLSGLDVNLYQRNNRLWTSAERGGTDTYHQQTASNGVARFPVLGKPQPQRLPSGAEPEDVTAQVRFETNVSGSDLLKDIVDLGWDALGLNAASMLASTLARMKLVTFTWAVPVRDWKLEADFDVVVSGTLWDHSAIAQGGVSQDPCGAWTRNNSTTMQGDLASLVPFRVHAHYLTDDGEGGAGLVFYPEGTTIEDLDWTWEGYQLAELPVGYEATRSHDEPGVDPMPEHYQVPEVGGCADGNPNAAQPKIDCGARDYEGLVTVELVEGALRVVGENPTGHPVWTNCGGRDSLTPYNRFQSCDSGGLTGGLVPSADSVFHPSGRFTISGAARCGHDSPGYLDRYTFDWTLTFCRVVEGESDC